MTRPIALRRSSTLLGVLLFALGAVPAHAREAGKTGSYVKRALPSGGHELRRDWSLGNGVRAEHVMQFAADGHKHLSQRATYGKNRKVTYTHTSYSPDGTVRERGRYKRWMMNGVRFSSSKRTGPTGKTTYSSQNAEGPTGKKYERSAYGGMVDVQKTWQAKNTIFGIYTRRFVQPDGQLSKGRPHRFGVKAPPPAR